MKFIFFIGIILNSICLNAQQIEGLGFLKIGRNETEIIDSLKSNGFKTSTIVSTMDDISFNVKPKYIYQYMQPKKAYYYGAPLVKGHTKYKITGLQIGGVDMQDIEVHFLDSKLVCIKINYVRISIQTLLSEKYGQPKEEVIYRNTNTCYSTSSGNFTVESIRRHYYFRKDDFIRAYIMSNISYELNCQLSQVTHLIFETDAYIRLTVEEKQLQDQKEGKKINLNEF